MACSDRDQTREPGAEAVEVAVSLPLDDETLASLASRAGPRFHLEDVRTAPARADIVLCPPCSPGALGRLKKEFPRAAVVVVEPGDGSVGHGPVSRMFDSGADSYLPRPSLRSLVSALGRVA